jgi:hypothetical protein
MGRKMRVSKLVIFFLLSACVAATAQVEVETESVRIIAGLVAPRVIGDFVFVDPQSKPTYKNAVVLTTHPKASVKAETFERQPAQFENLNKPGVYIFDAPGVYYVNVNLVDFENQIAGDRDLVITVEPEEDPVVEMEDEALVELNAPELPAPAAAFGGIAAKITEQARGLTPEGRTKFALAFSRAAEQMEAYQFREVEQAITYINNNRPRTVASNQLATFIGTDVAQWMPMDWATAIEYYREISKGLLDGNRK